AVRAAAGKRPGGADSLLPLPLDGCAGDHRVGADSSRLLFHAGGQRGEALLRPVLHQARFDRAGSADPAANVQDHAAGAGGAVRGRRMQGWLELVFWAGAGWCVYTYLLYPVLLWHAGVWAQVRRDWQGGGGEERRRGRRHEDEPPAVSVVIPVHNEAEFLAEKIANLRALDYPAERLEVIFVCDGCSDDSADRLRQAGAGWQVLEVRQQGKCSALNQGVERARHALLVLCDAPTLLARDAIRRLVSHFEDPA